MTTASAAAEHPPVSLRRGNPASPAGETPAAEGRPVVKRDTATSLSFGLPLAEELPVGEQVSLRRPGGAAPPEPAAPDVKASPKSKLDSGEELASNEDRRLLKERLSKSLANFTKRTGEAWKRLTETKVAKQVTEYIKSKHPYISLALGPVLGAGIGFINPEWGQWFLANSGNIRLIAGAAIPLTSVMEIVAGRETAKGRLARAARFVAWDVSLATMTAPFGVGVGIEGHEMMSEALKHFHSAPAPVEATAPPVEPSTTAQATEQPSSTATPAAPTAEAPPPTPIPDIQPTWEAGHFPSSQQLDWAHSHGNMTSVDIDGKGGADFHAYNLDTSDPNPEAYVHIKTGQVFYETPDGKWAVDINNDGIPDALYSQPPVPETSGSSRGLGLARPVSSGMQEGDPPPLENINLAGDATPDLFYDGSNWQLDINGDGNPDQPVKIDGFVNNGGVWDWSNIKITSPNSTYEWKFEDTGTGDGSWVQSDLLSPIERGVHDVNPDVTISAGEGKWHAGENYLKAILNNPATAADTDLVGKLSEGTGANTIASDAVKDVLESHNVLTTVDSGGAYHVNVDPSYNQEIGAEIQTTVDKINGWFTPGMDDVDKNKILAEMSKRGLIEVKNLTVEGLDGLSKLAAALKGGG